MKKFIAYIDKKYDSFDFTRKFFTWIALIYLVAYAVNKIGGFI